MSDILTLYKAIRNNIEAKKTTKLVFLTQYKPKMLQSVKREI